MKKLTEKQAKAYGQECRKLYDKGVLFNYGEALLFNAALMFGDTEQLDRLMATLSGKVKG